MLITFFAILVGGTDRTTLRDNFSNALGKRFLKMDVLTVLVFFSKSLSPLLRHLRRWRFASCGLFRGKFFAVFGGVSDARSAFHDE